MRRKKGTKLVAAILVIIMLFGLVGAGIMPMADEKNGTDGITVDSGEVTISNMTAKLVFVKNEQSEPDPAEENPGEENPGEENPGEENPGEENPGEEAPGEAEGEDAEITEIALTYNSKESKLTVEDKGVETLKAWLKDEGGSVYLQVTAKAKDYHDYTNVNETNPNGQLVDDKLIAVKDGKLSYGEGKIEIKFEALPTATITITGVLDARDGCSVKGYTKNANEEVVITATKDTVIELVPGFEFTSISKGEKTYEKIEAALASIGSSEEGNEQITAVVEKTDNEAPTFDATVTDGKLVINNVKDKLSEDGEELSVGDSKVDVKVYVNGKEVKLTDGEYSRKLNNKEVVTVKATDAADNSSDEKTVGKVLTIVKGDNVYENGAGSCTFTVTVDMNGLKDYEYRLALYKEVKEGLLTKLSYVCSKEITNGTSKYDLTVTSDGEYRIQLEPKWGTWAILTPTEAVSGFEVKFDHDAPTISADNLGEFINSLTIGVGEDAGQITVKDEEGGSGVDAVYCKIYYEVEADNPDGSTGTEERTRRVYVVGGEEKKDDDGKVTDDGFGKFINEATFTVVDFKQHKIDGEKLKIEVYAVDKAGNKSETKTYTATVDTTPPVIDNVAFECAKDKNGNAICTNSGDYHKADRTIKITVTEANGIDSATLWYEKNGEEIEVTTKDLTINPGNENGEYIISYTFAGDGVYRFDSIQVSDEAGNVGPWISGEEPFEIDTKKPEDIQLTWSDASASNVIEDEGREYYQSKRQLVVSVIEKNIDTDKSYVKYKADGEVKTVYFGEADKDNNFICKTPAINFDYDGEYEITEIKVVDLAGNTTEVKNDNDKKMLGGKFVIDTTNPIVSVSYTESKGAENGKYYNVIRTATISVTEANFDGRIRVIEDNVSFDTCTAPGVYVKLIKVEGDAEKDGKEPIFDKAEKFKVKESVENAVWKLDKDGNYTFTVTYDANNAYIFEIKVVDKALRYAQLLNDKDKPNTDTDFVIDKDIVAPVISGVSEGAAYPDECVPTITFTDANYASGDVKIYQTRDGQINRDVTSKFGTGINTNGTNGTGGVSIINTIAKVPENDGIYTIVATMTDMAGNRSESRVTFSVNRFGSVYKLGDEIANLRDSYVRSVKNDLVLTEINPDMLIAGSAKVSITRNGKPIDVIFDVAPNPDKNAAAIGSSGWYEYIYTISAKNFEKDGAYVITVSSTDEAENNSSTTSYEECSMEFKVDSTKPEFTSLVGLEKAIINAESAPVTFGVHDAIGISNITVYCDGKVIASFESKDITDVNNFEGKFVVPEGSNQVVRIVVVDLAGNVTDTEKLIAADELPEFMENIQDITVSTNFFVRWFANKLVFFGSIIGVIAVVAAAWWFLFGKKRSKSETNS